MNNNRIAKVWTGVAARTVCLSLLLALSVMTLTSMSSAQNAAPTLNFQGGIGVINVIGQNADSTLKLNVVRGVNPAGPWRIAALTASIGADGHISVVGHSLLLAAGEGIGTNAGASVHATLFCGTAGSALAFDEPGVKLSATGDFKINDFLTPVPAFPCQSPVLLIRNGVTPGQGVWFAAGIRTSSRAALAVK